MSDHVIDMFGIFGFTVFVLCMLGLWWTSEDDDE